MSSSRRVYKVAEKIRELVARHLLDMADPRFKLVTITAVTVTADLGEAKIYWSVSGEGERIQPAQAAFDAASGHFRHCLAEDLGLRIVPKLKFFYDDTLDTARAVEELFDRIKKEETAA